MRLNLKLHYLQNIKKILKKKAPRKSQQKLTPAILDYIKVLKIFISLIIYYFKLNNFVFRKVLTETLALIHLLNSLKKFTGFLKDQSHHRMLEKFAAVSVNIFFLFRFCI